MWKSIVILCFIVTLTSGSMMRNANKGSKLGETCEYDDDCDVVFSFCRAQQSCECKRGFEPGPSRDRCVATIGAVCSSTYDCTGLTNTECEQEVCSCKNGYVAHPSMKECLQVASRYQSSCVETAQCSTSFGDRSECRDNKCQCIPMHHFVDNMCIQSKKLDQLCINSKECHVSDDNEKNQQVQCTAGRCQCIMGFHMASDHLTCTDGASQTAATSIFVSIVMSLIIRILY